MLFLRRAHSPFIKNIYKNKKFTKQIIKNRKKNNNDNDVNIELGKTNRLKALCMMQIKKGNKQRQSMKIKSICRNQWQKMKHYTNKQHLLKQQTALNKQALYTALCPTALK